MIVHHEHVISSPTILTGRVRWRVGQIMIVVCGLPCGSQEPSKRISQPKSTKDVDSRFATMIVRFGVEEGNLGRQTIVSPNLHDVHDQLRFLVESSPRGFATIVRIMFKRHESQVPYAAVLFQVIKEPAEPGGPPSSVWPCLDIFCDSFE